MSQRLAELTDVEIDRSAMDAIGGLYRAAGAVRNHLERTTLASYELSWTGWVVLWVVWVWREIESRHAAAEAGITKSTLSGVVLTLENRGLVRRRPHPTDGRRVILSLTTKGNAKMPEILERFNAEEARAVAPLTANERQSLTDLLRKVADHLESANTTVTLPR